MGTNAVTIKIWIAAILGLPTCMLLGLNYHLWGVFSSAVLGFCARWWIGLK